MEKIDIKNEYAKWDGVGFRALTKGLGFNDNLQRDNTDRQAPKKGLKTDLDIDRFIEDRFHEINNPTEQKQPQLFAIPTADSARISEGVKRLFNDDAAPNATTNETPELVTSTDIRPEIKTETLTTTETTSAPLLRKTASYAADMSIVGGMFLLFFFSSLHAYGTQNLLFNGKITLGALKHIFALPMFTPVFLLLITLYFLYYLFTYMFLGKSLGMKLFRLKVVDSEGNDPGALWLFARVTFQFVITTFLGVGFLPAAFNKKSAGVHDFLTKTFVIRDLPDASTLKQNF